MAKRDIKQYICRPFCSFYREGVKEELICYGARLIENLLQQGVVRVTELPGDGHGFSLVCAAQESFLDNAVCALCAFRREDCDFRSQPRPADAEPCGGYILIDLLLQKGVLSPADLTECRDEE
jgi:hypothetical protein